MCRQRFNSGAIAGLIALAVVVIAYSCSVREDRKVAKDEVGITMLSIEQRQDVINRLGDISSGRKLLTDWGISANE